MFKKSKLSFCLTVLLTLVFSFQTMAFASEEENKRIADECKRQSMEYSDGDGQTTPLCQQAMYYQCLADNFRSSYPDQSRKLESNRDKVCKILKTMIAQCPSCN